VRGFIIHPERKPYDCSFESLLPTELKSVILQNTSGTQYFFNELQTSHNIKIKDSSFILILFSNRKLVAPIVSVQKEADTRTHNIAKEFGLGIIELGGGSIKFCGE
jgi:hypothetical protein